MSDTGAGLVRVVGFPSQGEADEAATALLEHGIGFEVLREEDPSANLLTGTGTVHAIHVLEIDLGRAREVLGLVSSDAGTTPPPAEASAGAAVEGVGPTKGDQEALAEDPAEAVEVVHSFFGGRLRLTTRQVWRIALIYLAAFILIPALFYLGTRWVMTPDVETPDVTVQQSPVFTID